MVSIPDPQEFIGYHREGFERLRDVITKYRRAWGQKHLDAYLRTRAESSVRWAAQTYYRKTAERGGRPPTLKQFAGTAMGPTNRWFGGDISTLYQAFGEKSPVSLSASTVFFKNRILRQVLCSPYPDDPHRLLSVVC